MHRPENWDMSSNSGQPEHLELSKQQNQIPELWILYGDRVECPVAPSSRYLPDGKRHLVMEICLKVAWIKIETSFYKYYKLTSSLYRSGVMTIKASHESCSQLQLWFCHPGKSP